MLYLVNNLRLPSEKAAGLQTMTMAAEFAQLGPVTLVVPDRGHHDKHYGKDPFAFYGIAKSFNLKKIPCLDWTWLKNISERWWFFLLNFSFLISAFFSLRSKIKNSDSLYTRDAQMLPIFSRLCRKKSCRFFWECHAVPKNIGKITKTNPDGLITLTAVMKSHSEKGGFPKEKILVAHDGVHLAPYAEELPKNILRESLQLPQDKMIFTYMGRFQTLGKEKGIPEIIKAAAHFNDNPSILFLFVGGPMEAVSDYLGVAKVAGTKIENLEFRDRVAHEKVPAILKASDVLLMPFPKEPHYEVNMSPLKMFEYLAAGRAIIASDLATIREVLSVNEAVFCTPGNVDSLATAIQTLVNDVSLTQKLGLAGETLAKSYTWTQRAQNIANKFELFL